MTKGREAVVRFINHQTRPSSIHLHGSYSRTPFDGWAEDVTNPGEYKDYYYPNSQPSRTLWYHVCILFFITTTAHHKIMGEFICSQYQDHAIGITAINAYFGQAGFYVSDRADKANFLLTGGRFWMIQLSRQLWVSLRVTMMCL
jgi:bilirubin oxidase